MVNDDEDYNSFDIAIPDADEGQDFGSLDLTILADQRRGLVKTALKNIFRRIIGTMYYQLLMKLERGDTLGFNLASLIEERRVTGRSPKNIIERRVFDGPVSDVSLFQMCRLMGLYMSTQFPTSYIKEIWIDPIINTCTLDDGITQKRFKKMNGEWWQISPDDDTVRPLEEHLR
ncbi:uncharacterized protein LOC126846828 isoform X1 [Adelges cooleyi]|uniref:uncharacterized protein LOC126846828 isoform X1 n=1 Tax=Adelges cooleyi TaxID=133065 RepID=UPI0021808E17|nr:uncharacterized protein LOC126846828 isoform X1 [Adelges cooleyi]